MRLTCPLLAIVLAAGAAGCARGPQVEVSNTSTDTLSAAAVRFSGGEVPLGVMRPGETRTVTIVPRGESHLTRPFVDPRGKSHEQALDVYFEAGYRSTLAVRIAPDLSVSWSGQLRR